jgi:hypothetical protein
MPITECQKDGKPGFKWGETGTCFTGSDARSRARAVGRAIYAQRAKFEDEDEWSSQAELEALIGAIPADDLPATLSQLDPMPEEPQRTVLVKKADDELRVVWGEVYVPNIPDTDDEFMTAVEIEKMAHKFLMHGLSVGAVDVQHDRKARPDVYVVESFIARKGDPDFIEGAWVAAVKILDDDLWEAVKSGELNGFSMQASVFTTEREVELEIPERVEGLTQISSDGDDHRHTYTVKFDSEGDFLGGSTNLVDGHMHMIRRRSISEDSADPTGAKLADGHFHRYTLLDKLAGREEEEVPWGFDK